jgi:citrate lyase subunit alpha/citrate CoA-transferase
MTKCIPNALGRDVPVEYRPFRGPEIDYVPSFLPEVYRGSRCETKVRSCLREAIERTGLANGDTISFHHALRNGDAVMETVMRELIDRGFSDLVLAPSSIFPCQIPVLLEAIGKGVIVRIRGGSVRGELGELIARGGMRTIFETRSHSGRAADIETGQLGIDVTFCAASSADRFGNFNGWMGKPNSMFGFPSFMVADAKFSRKGFVVMTDRLSENIVPSVLMGMQNVTDVVVVDSIGDNHGLSSGETARTKVTPERSRALSNIVAVIKALGLKGRRPCVQLGSGMGLAAIDHLAREGIKIDMMIGGVTEDLIAAVNAGLVRLLYNGQCFDRTSAITMRSLWSHTVPMDMFMYGSPYRPPVTGMLDVGLLGAVEVDRNFDVNVTSFSNGIPAKAIGGHTDVARGASVVIVQAPLNRKGNVIVRDRVTTVSTPGRYCVDFVMTPKGLIVNDLPTNPKAERNLELRKRMEDEGVTFLSMDEAIAHAKDLASEFPTPIPPEFGERVVGVTLYSDGTALDSIREVTNIDEVLKEKQEGGGGE